jgi:Glycosyl transferase family 2
VSHFIRNEKNTGGPYKQWVKGVELAVGENIWIAESDDFCDSGFLKRSVEELEKDSAAGLTFCKSVLMDEGGNPRINTPDFFEKLDRGSGNYEGIDFINQFLFNNCILNVSSVVFKKKVFENFETDFADLYRFSMYGDWYIYLTVAMRWNIIYFAEPLNYFRRSTNSYSSRELDFIHLKERLILQNYILKHTHNHINYNKVLDHLYYEAYGLLNDSSLGLIRKLLIASHFILHDKFGWRRSMYFAYNKIKIKYFNQGT